MQPETQNSASADRDPSAVAPPPLPDGRSAPSAGSPALVGAQRLLGPLTQQAWLNCQVWLPPLMNPPTKARQVVYWARQHRERGVWQIALPAQCWSCGVKQGLSQRNFEFAVRSFDNAIAIVVGFGALLLFMLLIGVWLGSKFLLLLTLLLTLAAVGALWLKSWTEAIHVVLSTCPQHAHEATAPEAVVDQEELHLFLANDTLAGATRLALQEERRSHAPAGAGTGAAAHAPAPGAAAAPTGYSRSAAPELPPIKLDGDE